MGERKAAKKPAPTDWHRADIVAGLRKAGWTVRKLAKHHGYASHGTLTVALSRPFPKAQRLIAEAIGVAPELIWPSRYECNACVNSRSDTHVLTRQSSEVQAQQRRSKRSSLTPCGELHTSSLEQASV